MVAYLMLMPFKTPSGTQSPSWGCAKDLRLTFVWSDTHPVLLPVDAMTREPNTSDSIAAELASNVLPPLLVGLVSLTAINFNLTFSPSSTTSARGLKAWRLLLAIPALYGFYDFGFGHYKEHNERVPAGVRE